MPKGICTLKIETGGCLCQFILGLHHLSYHSLLYTNNYTQQTKLPINQNHSRNSGPTWQRVLQYISLDPDPMGT